MVMSYTIEKPAEMRFQKLQKNLTHPTDFQPNLEIVPRSINKQNGCSLGMVIPYTIAQKAYWKVSESSHIQQTSSQLYIYNCLLNKYVIYI